VHGTDHQDRVVPRFRMYALLCSLPRSLDGGVVLYLSKFILYPVEESESVFKKFTVGYSRSISRNKAFSKVRRGPAG